jgi:predicted transcriptional regulator
MAVLWRLGSGTVTEVRDQLADPLAYNTVLTVLRTLEAKSHVRHEEEGKAHRYFPTVAREQAGTSGLQRLVDTVYAGSADALLTPLVSDRRLSRARLARLRALIDERLGNKADDR